MLSRKANDHSVDLSTCIEHWSYDFMVRSPTSTSFQPLLTATIGRLRFWLCKRIGEDAPSRLIVHFLTQKLFFKELMRDGDPNCYVQCGKRATALFDM